MKRLQINRYVIAEAVPRGKLTRSNSHSWEGQQPKLTVYPKSILALLLYVII